MSTVESRLSTRAARQRQASDRNKKILLAVMTVVFVVLLVIQVPKLMNRGGKSSAAATETLPQLPPVVTTPTTTHASVGGTQTASASAAKLRTLRRGASRDPFAPLVHEPESQTPAESSPSSSSATSPPAATAEQSAEATTPAATSPAEAPPAAAPLPAPTAAILWTNGSRQIVGLSQFFNVADTSFRIVALSRKAVQISIPGGALADGRTRVTIRKGHQIVLVNTATGVRYVVRFASGTFAAPTVGGAAPAPPPAAATPLPTTPVAPTTTTAGATQ